MTPDETLKHYGLPPSAHRQTLASETEMRRLPVGYGLIIAGLPMAVGLLFFLFFVCR